MKLEHAKGATITQLWSSVEASLPTAKCVEEAAQALATSLYTQFQESVALTRVYMTVPYGDLPTSNQAFVQGLTASAGADVSALRSTTPVLSLLGTRGQEPEWNDRRNSKGHKGIPLLSAAFVSEIPMISRLLKELGVPMDWIDSHDARRIVSTIGTSAGLFYVDDAAQAVDDQGRKVIPAQDFVSGHSVKTVFGAGGAYGDGQILVLVLFCREPISRSTAELFMPLSDLFRRNTALLAAPDTVFRAD